MLTLEQAAKILGMTPRQLRRRIEATSPLLAPYMGRGDKNRILLNYGAIKILQDVEARRANGATLKEAIAEVADSLQGNQEGKLGQDNGQSGGEVFRGHSDDLWGALVAELRNRVRFLEEENARLWSLVNDLKTQLALPPPPPRRSWWLWSWPWSRTRRGAEH